MPFFACSASRRGDASCVLLAAGLFLSLAAVPSPGATAVPGDGRLEPGLAQELAAAGPEAWIAVGVTLRDEALPPAGAARRAAVAEGQQHVLDDLPPSATRLRRRYEALAGLALWVQPAAARALGRHPEVRSVYRDGRLRPTLAQGVPQIGADAAHALGLTGAGVNVAVLDTGIDTDHPDLADDLVAEECFCSGSHPSPQVGCCPNGGGRQSGAGAAEDDAGHGTSVSGIVTSGGVVAPGGVAPDAGVVAIRVLGPQGASFSDVAAGLDWVLTHRDDFADPIRVVNLSLGDGQEHADPASTPCSGTNTANAIQALHAAGVAVFASSGNDGFAAGLSFPACVAEAISVGGVYDASFSQVPWCADAECTEFICTDTNVGPDDFVCHSNSHETLDLLAPNYRTRTPGLGGGVQNAFAGTSASSPYAAGQAALLLEASPSLAPDLLRAELQASGASVTHPGSGLVFPRSDVGEAAGALLAVCGNDILEPGEECDDGGTAGGDCCDPSCQLEPEGSPCDDGDACSTDDTCSAGSCEGGSPPDCDDGDPCTAESCDALEGCVSTPIPGCGEPAVPSGSGAAPALLLLLLTAAAYAAVRRR